MTTVEPGVRSVVPIAAIREATYLLAVGVVATVTAPVVAAATRTVSALIGSRRGCSGGGSGSSGVLKAASSVLSMSPSVSSEGPLK